MSVDVNRIKQDFPVLQREINGKDLVYLDSANTSQKPNSVISAMDDYYSTYNANVHRGSYQLANEATAILEGARDKVTDFINANSRQEIVFTKNATEAINLVSNTWGRTNLTKGDVIVLTELEHHANIVPWHILAEEKEIEIRWIKVTDDGDLDLSDFDTLIDGAKLLSFAAMSNVLGTFTPAKELSERAHAAGAKVLIDASQYTPHSQTDVQELGADFLTFTGHKLLGPMGIGVLWGKEEILDAMPPFLGGGEMILNVTKEGFSTNELPWKFEAGTPMVAEAAGLGAAIDYLNEIGMDQVRSHEISLMEYALAKLKYDFGDSIRIYGPKDAAKRGGVLSFSFEGAHPHDIAQILDEDNICIRAGHHCAKPLMQVLGVGATSRASAYLYNDESEIDALVEGLRKVRNIFNPN
ncbi:MAG: cysteine desulfurase [Actinomycetota bacterium]